MADDRIGQGTPEHRFIQRIRGLEARLADLEEERTSDEAVNIIRRIDDIQLSLDAYTTTEYTPGILADNDANGTVDFGTIAGGILRFDFGSATPVSATPAAAPSNIVAVYDEPGSTTQAEAFTFTAPTEAGDSLLITPPTVVVSATPSVATSAEVIAQDGASAITATATPATVAALTPPVDDSASTTTATIATATTADTTVIAETDAGSATTTTATPAEALDEPFTGATDDGSTTAVTATTAATTETTVVGFGRMAWDDDEWGSPSS